MEKIIKIGIFVVFVGYMVLGMIVEIPSTINNVVYGIMAICAVFFIITNKDSMGLNKESLGVNKIFKKKSK